MTKARFLISLHVPQSVVLIEILVAELVDVLVGRALQTVWAVAKEMIPRSADESATLRELISKGSGIWFIN